MKYFESNSIELVLVSKFGDFTAVLFPPLDEKLLIFSTGQLVVVTKYAERLRQLKQIPFPTTEHETLIRLPPNILQLSPKATDLDRGQSEHPPF